MRFPFATVRHNLTLRLRVAFVAIFLFIVFINSSQADQKRLVRHRVESLVDIQVPMRDGTKLSTNVYMPAIKDGSFPVILARLPYGKDIPGMIQIVAKALAQRGAAFVIQDCRGRFKSEGTFTPFVNEVNDGADTISWIQKQPWANGKIGLVGFSYLGYTAWAAAVGARGNVDAIVTITSTAQPYRMIYHQGAFNYMLALDWLMFTEGKTNNPTSTYDWYRPQFAPLHKIDDIVNKDLPQYNRWVENPTPGGMWNKSDLSGKIGSLRVPTLFIGGWYDIFAQDVLDDFQKAAKVNTAGNQSPCLLMGPWAHNLNRRAGDVDFGAQAGFEVIATALASWLEGYLLNEGRFEKPTPRVMYYVMGANRWKTADQWPLPGTRFVDFYLHSESKGETKSDSVGLSLDKPKKEIPDRFTFDPKRPVPTVGGCVYPPQFAGAKDQRAVERRKDVLIYTSSPLTSTLEIAGPISMTLYASTSAKDTDFTAKLVAVEPDGRVINLQDGIVRARFRNGSNNNQKLNPGSVVKYNIDLWSTAYQFQKGQRIRVEISSSNFPRFDVNRNTGNDPATDNDYIVAEQVIYHDANHPSHITLPIVGR